MSKHAGAVSELVEQLGRLPGVGRKSAERLAFHLLRVSEQEALALLVRCHRRKISLEQFDAMSEVDRSHLLRLTVILRLACLFKYVEQLETLPSFRVSAKSRRIKLQFPNGWVEQHPLTVYELRQERAQLRKLGIRLSIR